MGVKTTVAEVSESKSFEISFNGRPVRAYAGDTIAAALIREGAYVFSRSLKFHRPRGYFCGSGRCVSCVMRMNGIPSVRTCSTPAMPGTVVRTERGFPSTSHDILSIFDRIFGKEFDYQHRFIRPSFMTPLYELIIRRLASSSGLPDSGRLDSAPLDRRTCDVLVIGRGVSGSVAHAHLQGAEVSSMIMVDNRMGPENSAPSTAFGFYENGEVGALTGNRIQLIKARAVLIATGRNEVGLPLVNGDLPGVMLPEAVRQLASRGIRSGNRAVLVGKNELRDIVEREVRSSGGSVVASYDDPTALLRVLGRRCVRGVEARDDTGVIKRVKCDLVVPLGPLVPSVELAQQAGCELAPVAGLWCVRTDRGGATSVPGVYASGGVTGLVKSEDRIASGKVVASTILKSLGGS